MNRHLKRKQGEIDGELRGAAPQADEAFVRSLAGEVNGVRPTSSRSRYAFTSALVVMVLGALASFGGVGYAASSANQAAANVKAAISHKTSAQGQYDATAPVVKGVSVTRTSKSKPAKAQPVAASGTLPFTGLSLIGTLALGGALVGAGVALRRRESRD